MNYKGLIFIDVETADEHWDSICQLSYAIVDKENKIIKEFDEKIKPYDDYSLDNFRNTDIHGIKWSDVKNCRKFKEIWQDIKDDFNGDYLVFAHNAAFDMGCLKSVLTKNGIKHPKFNYACTYQSLRKVRPDLVSYKLNDLAKINKIKFKHHDAYEDIKVTIAIFKKYFLNLNGYERLIIPYNLKIKTF